MVILFNKNSEHNCLEEFHRKILNVILVKKSCAHTVHISKTTCLLERHNIIQLLWNSVPALLHALTFESFQTTFPTRVGNHISNICAGTKLLWQAALLFFLCDCTWTHPFFSSMFGCIWLPSSSWIGGGQTPQQLWGVSISASYCAPGFAPCLVHPLWQSSLGSFPSTFFFLTVYLWLSHSITG